MNTNTNTHNTHNPFTGDGVTNTRNPLTGDKTGPHPPSGTNPLTGRTKDGDLGRHEQHPPEAHHTSPTGTGVTSHNTHNPLTGDGVTNTHNPVTGDKTGPHPPVDTNPVTGRTNDDNFGRHEQQPIGYTGTTGTHTGAHTGARTGAHTTGAGLTSGSHTHNTHNPMTGDGVTNTRNPLTGDKTGPHPPADTNPVTGRTNDGNLGRHEQDPTSYTGTTGAHTTGHTGTHTSTHTGAHTGAHTTGAGTGVTGSKTHNPMTDPHAIHDTTRGAHTTGAVGTTGTGAHPTATQTSGGGAKAIIGKVEATLGSIIKNPDMHAKGVQKQEEAQAAKLAKQETAHDRTDIHH